MLSSPPETLPPPNLAYALDGGVGLFEVQFPAIG